jgi:hypothetical protein
MPSWSGSTSPATSPAPISARQPGRTSMQRLQSRPSGEIYAPLVHGCGRFRTALAEPTLRWVSSGHGGLDARLAASINGDTGGTGPNVLWITYRIGGPAGRRARWLCLMVQSQGRNDAGCWWRERRGWGRSPGPTRSVTPRPIRPLPCCFRRRPQDAGPGAPQWWRTGAGPDVAGHDLDLGPALPVVGLPAALLQSPVTTTREPLVRLRATFSAGHASR